LEKDFWGLDLEPKSKNDQIKSLKTIFDMEPNISTEKPLKAWTILKPFKLNNFLKSKLLQLNKDLNILITNKGDYCWSGQVCMKNKPYGIGRWVNY
jgi:hypothetical protein